MKSYLVCIITLLTLFVGCAPKTWQKDVVTQIDYERDKLACEEEANAVGYGHNVFNICMKSKGYSFKTKRDIQQ